MINLFQSMIWAKLRWDLSFAKKIDLRDLLPQINNSYPIALEWNEDYAEEGKAFFLWLPPHSELNGLFDKRPSEILKSYILEGTLTDSSLDNCQFNFYLEKITPLTEMFDRVEEVNKLPLPLWCLANGTTCIVWEQSRSLLKAQLGSYSYLAGFSNETQLEAVFSRKQGKLYLHYSAYLPPSSYETIVTKYCLDKNEESIFKALFDRAEEIYEPEIENLSKYEVQGAEYH